MLGWKLTHGSKRGPRCWTNDKPLPQAMMNEIIDASMRHETSMCKIYHFAVETELK